MIVPFIYDLEVVSDYDHISVFYFYLSEAKKHGWPMIAHERYFMKPSEFYEKIMSREQLKPTAEFLHFDMPEDKDMDRIGQYFVSQQFEDEMLAEFGSRMDCWTQLLSKDYVPFENYINEIFDRIEEDYSEKIEAILCFFEPIALRRAADKRGIRVIHQEGTMYRTPFYRMAGFFDFKEGYGKGELEERYYRFKKEIKNREVKLFSCKEICALFMTSQGLTQLDLFDTAPQYEMGVGLVDLSLCVNLKDSLINTDEVFLEARKNYPMDQITTRSRYRVTGCDDNSPSAYHFILKCKRVAALHSNLIFETMLLGRTACVYGASPFAFMGNKGIMDKSHKDIPLDFINFTTFGYFVPWEMLRDEKYIRWRLSSPSEIEIYEEHMKFYLEQRGIDRKILQEQGDLLQYILETQNVKADKEYQVNKKVSLQESYDVLHEEHKGLTDNYEALLKEFNRLQEEYKKLVDNYEALSKNYDTLNKEYGKTVTGYDILVKEYTLLHEEHGQTAKAYETLMEQYNVLIKSSEISGKEDL